jgi:hypothetical protein
MVVVFQDRNDKNCKGPDCSEFIYGHHEGRYLLKVGALNIQGYKHLQYHDVTKVEGEVVNPAKNPSEFAEFFLQFLFLRAVFK